MLNYCSKGLGIEKNCVKCCYEANIATYTLSHVISVYFSNASVWILHVNLLLLEKKN